MPYSKEYLKQFRGVEPFKVNDPGRTECGPTGLPDPSGSNYNPGLPPELQPRVDKVDAGPQGTVCYPDEGAAPSDPADMSHNVDLALRRFHEANAQPTPKLTPMQDIPEDKR